MYQRGPRARIRRAMYVNGWSQIFNNSAKVISLGMFCHLKGIEELLLYDLHVILTSVANLKANSTAFRILRECFDVKAFGAAFSSNSQVDQIVSYQNNFPSNSTSVFNSMILEYEWWNEVPRNFGEALSRLTYAKSGGTGIQNPMELKAYVGWITQSEALALAGVVDELAVHAYVTDPVSAFPYTRSRLEFFTESSSPIKVRPIFSVEDGSYRESNGSCVFGDTYLGPWLRDNSLDQLEQRYQDDFDAWPDPAKSNVDIVGFLYFAYSHMWQNSHLNLPEKKRAAEYLKKCCLEPDKKKSEINFLSLVDFIDQ